ncbi:AAA family ATPase [Terribacillus saccharophilus]|uniref:AAA family ATPase n=1 Tax=Terribacillus saccharophilus TaxID=361277 RepID=UPI003981E8C0
MSMIIMGGHVYAFGKLHDYTFDFQGKSLVIIQGDNEAGKSTLKAFIFYILFGMRSRELDLYIPRNGGTPGGRLQLSFPDGVVTVERIRNQHDGQAVCYTVMGQQDQNWLEKRLGGVDAAVFQQVFSVDTETLVSLQMTDREQLGKVLLDAGQSGAAAIHKLEKRLQQDLQQLFRPQGKKPKINSMLQSYAEQERLVQALEQKESAYLPDKDKLERVQRNIADLQTQKADLRGKINVQNQIMQAIPWQKKIAFTKEQLQKLAFVDTFPHGGLEQLQEMQHLLQPLEAQLHVHTNEAAVMDAELGKVQKQLMDDDAYDELYDLTVRIDWDVKRKHIHELAEEHDRLMNQANSVRSIHPFPERFINDDSLQRAQAEWRPMQEEAMILQAESDRTDQYIASKRQELNKLDQLQERIQQELLSEKEYRELHSEKDKKHDTYHSRKGIVSPILLLLVFGVLLSGIGIVTASWIMTGSGFFLLGGAVLFWRNGSKLSGTSSYTMEKLTEQQDLRVRSRQLEEQRHPSEIQLAELQHQQSEQLIRKEKLQQKVDMYRKQLPFLQHIPLADWLQATQEWKAMEQLEQSIERAKQEREQERHHYESLLHRLRAIAEVSDDLTVEECIKQAEYMRETQQKLRHAKEQLLGRLHENKQQLGMLKKQIKPLQEQKAQLFASAGAEDDRQFQQLWESYRKRKQLADELAHYQLQLESILPDGRYVEEYLYEPEVVEKTIASLEMEQEVVEADLDGCRQQAATLQVKLADLEADTEASAAYHELQRQKQLLTAAGRKWAVRKMAYEMLQQTKQSFQEERFPKVLQEASRLFAKVTDTYTALILNEEGKLIVKDEHSRMIELERLSRGTIEQLYVCLRLALSRFLGVGQGIPLLIDDAFSHTDQSRRARFLPVLEAAADVQQIILFTWESPTTEWMRDSKVVRLGKTQKTSF